MQRVRFYRRLIIILVPLIFYACGASDPPGDETILVIGSTRVGADRFKNDLACLAPGTFADRGEGIAGPLLDRVINFYLILEYGKQNGITVPPARFRRYLKDVKAGYTPGVFKEALLRGDMDPGEWKKHLADRLKARMILKKVSEQVPLPDYRDVKRYYDRRPAEFRTSERLAFRQIVTRTRKEAEAVRKRILQGEDMGILAGKYSIAPEAERSGEVGWISRGQLEKTMEKALFSLPVGKISPVVRTPYGYHIFEVMARQPAGLKPLAEVAGEITGRLLEKKRGAFLSGWIRDLKKRFRVRINHKRLKQLEMH